MIKHNYSRAKLHHELQIMRGNELCDGQIAQNAEHISPAARVEIAGGFIQRQNLRVTRQKSRQTNSPLLASAKSLWGALLKTGQSNHFQSVSHFRSDFVRIQPELLRSKGNVFAYGGTEELVVSILKQQSDLRADFRKMSFNERRAKDANRSFLRVPFRKKPIQMEQQGGFARAVRSHKADSLARADAEIHIAQCFRSVIVAEGQVLNLQRVQDFHPLAHMAA